MVPQTHIRNRTYHMKTASAKQPKRKPLRRLQQLSELLPDGYQVSTWSPRTGANTRYLFFREAQPNQMYMGSDKVIFLTLNFKEAVAFAKGLNG